MRTLTVIMIVLMLGAAWIAEAAPNASACPGAKRLRWFPLGTIGGDVLVAEIDEYRTIVAAHGGGKWIGHNLYWMTEQAFSFGGTTAMEMLLSLAHRSANGRCGLCDRCGPSSP